MNKKTPHRKISETNKLHQKIRERKDKLDKRETMLDLERCQFEHTKKKYEAEMIIKLQQEKTKIKHEILEKNHRR